MKQLSGSPTNNFRVPMVGDIAGDFKSGQVAYDSGIGFWMGNDGGTTKFSIGDSAGDKMTWDGNSLDITGSLTATSGTIGGFTIGATTISATNLSLDSSGQRITLGSGNDIVILDADDATYRIWVGNTNPVLAPFKVEKDGSVIATDIAITSGDLTGTLLNANSVDTVELVDGAVVTDKINAGAVTADKITVSELSAITADLGDITAGTIVLPSGGFVRSGQTAYDTGTGFWLGNDAGTPKFSIGNSAGDSLTWDGSSLDITGNLIADSGTIGGFTIGATSIVATNLTLDSSGQRISLGSGNDIIILDADDATYRIWVGNSTAASAPFRVEKDGSVVATDISITSGDLTGTFLNANSVDTGEIVNGAVTVGKLTVSELSAITADMGDITAGTITLDSSGHIKGGQTDYATGTGFWIGYDSNDATHKFSIGSNTNYLRWTGTSFVLNDTFKYESDVLVILAGTPDNSDTIGATIYGGGSTSQDRGALLQVYGVDRVLNPGTARLMAGNVTGGYAEIKSGDALSYIRVNQGGDIEFGGALEEDTTNLIHSGTYTPTATAVTNVDSCTGNSSQYMRVGDVVTVSGSVSIDPTTSGVASNIRISLPIASNFANARNGAGTAAPVTGTANNVAVLSANTANDSMDMDWVAGHTASREYFFHFTYRII